MTTPNTMGSILSRLRERLAEAEQTAAKSSKIAMNSYGAGHDAGYASALRDTLNEITGE